MLKDALASSFQPSSPTKPRSYGPRFDMGLSNPAPAPDAIPNLSAGFTVTWTPGVVSTASCRRERPAVARALVAAESDAAGGDARVGGG